MPLCTEDSNLLHQFTVSRDISAEPYCILISCIQTNHSFSTLQFTQNKGGIISKIRRRLTVQGDSENIDGAAASIPKKAAKEPEATEDVSIFIYFLSSKGRKGVVSLYYDLTILPHTLM